ncbi:hypothetical protein AC578_7559 [Pseudocercospora eumusae]|uniref:BTB domain-containing protein n=1 Tax=Pseudocercospora eumusae TaxID=321146 RepID=A0A139HRP8_9PEZI|nr:hypothetical protein AC578_7559 [Pseudocercospora eumusae]
MASTESQDVPVHIIAAEGDLILAVGSPVKVRLHVSSEVLKNTSPVFSTLLSPHFREGQALPSAEVPTSIKLPEDLPDGMTYLCKLLHGKEVEQLSLCPKTEDLLQAAIAADKYAAMPVLQLQMQSWLYAALDDLEPVPCEEKLSRIACIAYLARHKRAFAKATRRLILDCTGNFDRSGDGITLSDYMPPRVFEAVSYCRLRAWKKIVMEVPLLQFGHDDDVDRDEAIADAFQSDAVGWAGEKRTIADTAFCILNIRGLVDAHEALSLSASTQDGCSGLCVQCVLDGGYLTTACSKEDH